MANKKMNLSNLKTLESKTFTKKKVICGDYEVIIDEKFKETKIPEMMKEYIEKMKYAKENNINLNISDYSMILLLKNYTDIEFPNELEKQIQVLKILVDLGFLGDIVSAFDENEMKKLTDKLYEISNNITKINDTKEAKI